MRHLKYILMYLEMFYLPLWIRQKASIGDHLNIILVAFFSQTLCCLHYIKEKYINALNIIFIPSCGFLDLFSCFSCCSTIAEIDKNIAPRTPRAYDYSIHLNERLVDIYTRQCLAQPHTQTFVWLGTQSYLPNERSLEKKDNYFTSQRKFAQEAMFSQFLCQGYILILSDRTTQRYTYGYKQLPALVQYGYSSPGKSFRNSDECPISSGQRWYRSKEVWENILIGKLSRGC